MSVVEGPKSAGLVARVQGILLHPKTTWDIIDTEPTTTQGLFTGYACILAAIPAIATMIGGFFPICVLGLCIHFNPIYVIVGAIVGYIVSLVGVFVMGVIIDGLAPSFDGQKNQIQSMKVAVYSMTAAWIAGIFFIVPALTPLEILGLYSFYLLYLGLPKLTKAPESKALGFTIVAVVLSAIVMVVAHMVGSAVTGFGRPVNGMTIGEAGRPVGTVQANGANVDLAKMQVAAAAASAQATAIQTTKANGKAVAAVDPEKLKSLLPDSVAGMPRTELSAQTAGAARMASSVAQAVYSKDAERVTVTVTDLAAMGALANMAGSMGVQSSRQTASGYEKTSMVNGRLTVEKWNSVAKSGEFSIIVAGRFAVAAEGNTGSIDDLKAAVGAVGPDRLEAMAKT